MSAEDSEKPMDGARLIKRYANRKLYDTHESKYVTLHEVAEFIRDGDDVVIIDNQSKDDLTSVTLAQIIYEEEKNSSAEKKRSVKSLMSFIEEGRGMFLEGREKLVETLPQPLARFMKQEQEREQIGNADQYLRFTKAAERTHQSPEVMKLLRIAVDHVQTLHAELKDLRARVQLLESEKSD